jgi:hypothetical protein
MTNKNIPNRAVYRPPPTAGIISHASEPQFVPLKFAKPFALTIRLSFAPLKAFSRPTSITGQVMNSLVIFNCKMLIRVIHSLI